jgi:hypothetical protein
MKNLSMALMAMAMVAGGCSKKQSGADKEIAQMSEFADAMCKCTDQQCTMQVMNEMAKHAQSVATETDRQPDADGAKKMAEVQKRMQECALKAQTAK